MSNLTPKQQQIVLVGIFAFFLVFATWSFVISPQGAKMTENEDLRAEFEDKKAKAETMIKNEKAFEEDLASAQARLDDIQNS